MRLLSRRIALTILIIAALLVLYEYFARTSSYRPSSTGSTVASSKPSQLFGGSHDAVPPGADSCARLVAPPTPPDPTRSFDWRRDLKLVHSNELHVGPVEDIKWVLKTLLDLPNVTFNDWNMASVGCWQRKSCSHRKLGSLGALDSKETIWNECPQPNLIKRKFFDEMKETFRDVDAFYCSMTPAHCELFMPFNKSIIANFPVPIEYGRESPDRWWAWVNNLVRLASDKRVILSANNPYHQLYVKYFTGLDVLLLPSYCGYAETQSAFNPTRPEILLGGHYHAPGTDGFVNEVNNVLKQRGTDFAIKRIHDIYDFYTWDNITQHRAIVNLPYCNSVMSYFEYYRTNVPMFFPTKSLSVKWEENHGRTRSRIYWRFTPEPAERFVGDDVPNPNDMFNPRAIDYWLGLSDFYQWPHLIYFDSEVDLAEKLRTTDFRAVSERMREHNKKVRADALRQWSEAFDRIFEDTPPGGYATPPDYDTAMRERWGTVLPPDQPHCQMYALASGPPVGFQSQLQPFDRTVWNVTFG